MTPRGQPAACLRPAKLGATCGHSWSKAAELGRTRTGTPSRARTPKVRLATFSSQVPPCLGCQLVVDPLALSDLWLCQVTHPPVLLCRRHACGFAKTGGVDLRRIELLSIPCKGIVLPLSPKALSCTQASGPPAASLEAMTYGHDPGLWPGLPHAKLGLTWVSKRTP